MSAILFIFVWIVGSLSIIGGIFHLFMSDDEIDDIKPSARARRIEAICEAIFAVIVLAYLVSK